MESRIVNMKRKRSSASSHTTDLCGSFLVNVLDLSKILNGKNKSKTVHKLTCLKELLDLSSGSSSTSTPTDTIVISDSDDEDSDDQPIETSVVTDEIESVEIKDDTVVQETKIKKETMFDHKKVSRFKKLKKSSSSCSENDDDESEEEEEEENDISKIKNYVKESLLKGLAINSHKFSNDNLTTLVKEEPVEVIVIDDKQNKSEQDAHPEEVTPEKSIVTSKETMSMKRKRIRLTKRRNSSYQGKRLLRYYRNLKKRPKLDKLISKPRVTSVTEMELETISNPDTEEEIVAHVEQETKETAVQVEELIDGTEIPLQETLPSSTTNDQDILTLSRLEELKVQITEDETTVYITILDGTTTIPDVLQVLECTTPTESEYEKINESENNVDSIVITEEEEEVNPYFSQQEYKSVYTTASTKNDTTVKTLYGIITYPEVKKNLVKVLGSTSIISSKKSESPYSYRTINDSVYTLSPTNCNYINHVHWTNTYPLSFITNVDSHKHLCVLKDLYGRQLQEKHNISNQPIDMRCNSDNLPKRQYPSEMPKSCMEDSYPFVPPVTTSFFPYNYHNRSPQRYGRSNSSPMRRNTVPVAQPIDVSYARKYMDQKKHHHSRYSHSYRHSYSHNNDYWKPSRSYEIPSYNQPQSFIDIPIHSPTYNIKIPPLRIPISAIAPQVHQNLPVSPSTSSYFNSNYHSSTPYYNNYFNNRQSAQSSSIMKHLLNMEPKSRFVWS